MKPHPHTHLSERTLAQADARDDYERELLMEMEDEFGNSPEFDVDVQGKKTELYAARYAAGCDINTGEPFTGDDLAEFEAIQNDMRGKSQ